MGGVVLLYISQAKKSPNVVASIDFWYLIKSNFTTPPVCVIALFQEATTPVFVCNGGASLVILGSLKCSVIVGRGFGGVMCLGSGGTFCGKKFIVMLVVLTEDILNKQHAFQEKSKPRLKQLRNNIKKLHNFLAFFVECWKALFFWVCVTRTVAGQKNYLNKINPKVGQIKNQKQNIIAILPNSIITLATDTVVSYKRTETGLQDFTNGEWFNLLKLQQFTISQRYYWESLKYRG